MISFNTNVNCEQARAFYYDFICEESQESVPLEVLGHIDKCSHCQAEVNRLKIILAEGDSVSSTNLAVITNLRLHFTYIGTVVTCKTARLFLSSLADPVLRISVPTPITVHFDKCEQCKKDLEAIRQLHLSRKQLCRLGQLFAEKPSVNSEVCSHIQDDVRSIVSMRFYKTSEAVLKHVCTCPACRNLIFQEREKISRSLLPVLSGFSCEEVSSSDLFDYCVPYGIDPATDQYAEFRSAFTSHVSNCPDCLGKMQQLHRAVYGILEREESGVATRFELEQSACDSVVSEPDYAYEDWPIKVEVLDKSEPKPEIVAFPKKIKQKTSAINLRRLRTPAVAAIILLGIGLFFFTTTPVVKAVDISQLYKTIEQIKNVYVATFSKDKPEPIQERWVSQDLNTMVIKNETQCALWNTGNKIKRIRDLNTGSTESSELSTDTIANIKKHMKASLGLLPFDNISDVPENAQWRHAADESIKTVIPGTQVYTLLWTEKDSTGSTVSKKWFYHIDSQTKLPLRIEQTQKSAAEEEYELITVLKITYPGPVEIQSAVENAGF